MCGAKVNMFQQSMQTARTCAVIRAVLIFGAVLDRMSRLWTTNCRLPIVKELEVEQR